MVKELRLVWKMVRNTGYVRGVTGNSGSNPERAMEMNSLSVKESTWQHSRKCEGKTFITCIVEK
jgi:hypothetical protein